MLRLKAILTNVPDKPVFFHPYVFNVPISKRPGQVLNCRLMFIKFVGLSSERPMVMQTVKREKCQIL